MKIRLVAMWTREFAIGILLWNQALGSLGASLHGRVRPSWSTRQNAASSLRADHMSRDLLALHKGRLLTDNTKLVGTRQYRQAMRSNTIHASCGHWTQSRQRGRRTHCRRRLCIWCSAVHGRLRRGKCIGWKCRWKHGAWTTIDRRDMLGEEICAVAGQ
jgi:hypothetical protein